MDISVIREEVRVPVAVMRISGAVTDNTQLEQKAQELFDAGTRNILLDLTDVPYMASSGLRALHFIYTLLRTDTANENKEAEKGIAAGTYTSPHLKLLKPHPHVVEVLRATGYDMFLEIYKDRQQALSSF